MSPKVHSQVLKDTAAALRAAGVPDEDVRATRLLMARGWVFATMVESVDFGDQVGERQFFELMDLVARQIAEHQSLEFTLRLVTDDEHRQVTAAADSEARS